MRFYYVYVLKSKKDLGWCIGHATDLRKRITRHNKGRNQSTKNRKPLRLIYYEACLDRKDAAKRERYLKSGTGRRYIKNRLKEYLNKEGYASLR